MRIQYHKFQRNHIHLLYKFNLVFLSAHHNALLSNNKPKQQYWISNMPNWQMLKRSRSNRTTPLKPRSYSIDWTMAEAIRVHLGDVSVASAASLEELERKDDILEQLRQCEAMYHKYAFYIHFAIRKWHFLSFSFSRIWSIQLKTGCTTSARSKVTK